MATKKSVKHRWFDPSRAIAYVMLLLGFVFLFFSAFFVSSVLAFIGLGLSFWGGLFLFITPSRHVKLELMNAIASSTLANIEKVIANGALNGKGIYLPPKYLKDIESSLVFIPSKAEQKLPEPEQIDEEKLYLANSEGMLLTPPGLALSKLFEREIGISFTRADLNFLQSNLPKLLVEEEIAEDVRIRVENSSVIVEMANYVFSGICKETRKLPKTHESLGCPLCSAIACALTKATGKPIMIENEEPSLDGKAIKIEYSVLEG